MSGSRSPPPAQPNKVDELRVAAGEKRADLMGKPELSEHLASDDQ